jgi:1-deoxy-D-xylulose-5-phosphate synthase
MMYTAQLRHGAPFAIRYPRGYGVMKEWRTPLEPMPIGKAVKLADGADVAILAIGHAANFALEAVQKLAAMNINATLYNMRFVKPIDEQALREVGMKFSRVITVEDGVIAGGMGSAVAEFFTANGYAARVTRLGVPDSFVEHGTVAQLQAQCGFDAAGIIKEVMSYYAAAIS